MKIDTKEITLPDGSKVHDINIYPNGGSKWEPRVIISCYAGDAAEKFLAQLKNLIEEYTVETFENEN